MITNALKITSRQIHTGSRRDSNLGPIEMLHSLYHMSYCASVTLSMITFFGGIGTLGTLFYAE